MARRRRRTLSPDARARAGARPAARHRRPFALSLGARRRRPGAARPSARDAAGESLDALVAALADAARRGRSRTDARRCAASKREIGAPRSRSPTSAASGTWSRRPRRLTRFADAAVGAALASCCGRMRAPDRLDARSRGARPADADPAWSCSRSASTARASSIIRATSTSSCSTTRPPRDSPKASSPRRCSCA